MINYLIERTKIDNINNSTLDIGKIKLLANKRSKIYTKQMIDTNYRNVVFYYIKYCKNPNLDIIKIISNKQSLQFVTSNKWNILEFYLWCVKNNNLDADNNIVKYFISTSHMHIICKTQTRYIADSIVT